MTHAGRQVLVVVDDPDIRAFVSELLAEEGYVVREATNGREALETLSVWRADVILLDLAMPEMDGWTLLARQQADAALAPIPVVIMSAQHGLHRDAALRSARAVLAKPFNIERLLALVGGLVG